MTIHYAFLTTGISPYGYKLLNNALLLSSPSYCVCIDDLNHNLIFTDTVQETKGTSQNQIHSGMVQPYNVKPFNYCYRKI